MSAFAREVKKPIELKVVLFFPFQIELVFIQLFVSIAWSQGQLRAYYAYEIFGSKATCFFFFFPQFILKCNVHSIQFTYLKYMFNLL